MKRLFICVLAIAGLATGVHRAQASVGATLPFTSYEAESGKLGGGAAVVALTAAPTTQFSSAMLEASGHAYVHLVNNGDSVTITNTTGQNINFINVRYSIPDNTTS